MGIADWLMLLQAFIMGATALVLVWYTVETKRLRLGAATQLEVMQRPYALQAEEARRAAEPTLDWVEVLAARRSSSESSQMKAARFQI